MSEQKLKPCPFCGYSVRRDNQRSVKDCPGCADSYDILDSTWNTRPIEDKLQAENARLRAALSKIQDTKPVWYYVPGHGNDHGRHEQCHKCVSMRDIARQALAEEGAEEIES